MFDFACEAASCETLGSDLDADFLACLVSALSDRELEALEDDLNFYSFAGVASPRILSLMEGAVALN